MFALTALAADEDPNRFGLSLRMGFNIEARFKDSVGYGSLALAGPATGGGLDRTYDDGFVRKDASGNQGGVTWNWGYDHASQVVDQTMQFHSATASALPTIQADGDPQWGTELTYERRLGQWSWGKWGLQAAFNWMDVDIHGSHTMAGNAFLLTDSYALGSVVPPLAPYAGSFAGPGPVLSDTPARTTQSLAGGALLSGSRGLDAQVYGWRLGPYLEIPVTDRFAIELSGGLAVGVVDSEFTYTERVVVSGAVNASSGHDHSSDVLAGGFVEGQLAFRLSDRVSIFAGAQFQSLPDFEQGSGNHKAQLNLGESVFCTLGLKVNF